MPLRVALFGVSHGEGWIADAINLSASGLLIARPAQCRVCVGDPVTLALSLGENATVSLEGRVVRVTEREIAVQHTRIPPEDEIGFWEVLGEYADRIET